jgi:hypothetical protein
VPTIYLTELPEHRYWQAREAAAAAGKTVEEWTGDLIAAAVADAPAAKIPGR